MSRFAHLGLGVEILLGSVRQPVHLFLVGMLATTAMPAATLPLLETRRRHSRRPIPYCPTRVPLSNGPGSGFGRRIGLQLNFVHPKSDAVGWLRPYPECARICAQRVKNSLHRLPNREWLRLEVGRVDRATLGHSNVD